MGTTIGATSVERLSLVQAMVCRRLIFGSDGFGTAATFGCCGFAFFHLLHRIDPALQSTNVRIETAPFRILASFFGGNFLSVQLFFVIGQTLLGKFKLAFDAFAVHDRAIK